MNRMNEAPEAETEEASEVDLQTRVAELEAEREELLRRRDAALAAISEDKNAYAALLEQQRDEAIATRREVLERRAAAARSRRPASQPQEIVALLADLAEHNTAVGVALAVGIAVAAIAWLIHG